LSNVTRETRESNVQNHATIFIKIKKKNYFDKILEKWLENFKFYKITKIRHQFDVKN
jgi:hypothetical protein